jgi:hypothetical protein
MEFTLEELDTEIWKDIKDYEGIYQVSSIGRVRSLDREEFYYNDHGTKCVRFRTGMILNPDIGNNGYFRVRLRNKENTKKMLVHRLVAFAFIDNPNPIAYDIINHKDSNPENNRICNLEWCDQKYNAQYKFTNNNYSHKGSKHPQATITEDIAKQIYILGHSGKYTNIELSEMFNVHKNMINNIKIGHTWSHVTKDIDIEKIKHKRGHRIKTDRGETFYSIAEASEKVGVASIGIRKCLNGKQNTSAGRKWFYDNDIDYKV